MILEGSAGAARDFVLVTGWTLVIGPNSGADVDTMFPRRSYVKFGSENPICAVCWGRLRRLRVEGVDEGDGGAGELFTDVANPSRYAFCIALVILTSDASNSRRASSEDSGPARTASPACDLSASRLIGHSASLWSCS